MIDSPTTDRLIHAVGLDGRARAVAVVATDTVEELRRIHDPSPTTTAAIGRLAMGALVLAGTLEKATHREPMVTLEVSGDGPAGRLVATASPMGWVRATAANPLAAAEPRPDGKLDVAGVVGSRGELVVTRDPGIGEPYRGVVPLCAGELAQDLAFYLSQSEQTPSAVVLGVLVVPDGRVSHAGGLMLQLLPGVSDDEAEALTARIRDMGHVTGRMADGEPPELWLGRIFADEFEILGEIPASFRCGCSPERVEAGVKLLGAEEIREIIRQSLEEPVTMTCEFCRSEYPLSTAELRRLLAEVEEETGVN